MTDARGTQVGGKDWREAASACWAGGPGEAPVHQQVTVVLAALLDREVWQPGDRIPGQRDLAEHFGISPLTANKSVAALVRQGRLIRQSGRRGTVVAPRRRMGTRHLAVVMHCSLARTTQDTYSAGVMRGIQSALVPLGFDHSVTFLENWRPDELAVIPRERLSGVLLVAPQESRWPAINRLSDLRVPAVVVGASWPAARVPTVDCDNFGGTSAAVEYLCSLGHTHIGCLYAWTDSSNHRDRLQAFRQVAARHGLPLRPHWMGEASVHADRPHAQAVRDAVRRWLSAPDRPSAVLVTDYQIVSVLMRVAGECGVRIPEDLSVIGFDDPFPASPFDIPLTTVEQPLAELGRSGVERLLALCEGRGNDLAGEYLPMRLVVRESCAVPGGAPAGKE